MNFKVWFLCILRGKFENLVLYVFPKQTDEERSREIFENLALKVSETLSAALRNDYVNSNRNFEFVLIESKKNHEYANALA